MDSLVARARNDAPPLRRSWMWLLACVILHLVAISRQVDVGGVSLFEKTVFMVFSPIQNSTAAIADGLIGGWSSLVELRAVGAENSQLKDRLRAAEMQLLSQRAAVEENARLRVILDLQPRLPMATVLADVVARNASPWFKTVSINKGSAQGVVEAQRGADQREAVGGERRASDGERVATFDLAEVAKQRVVREVPAAGSCSYTNITIF